ncbi:hypothetical protein ATB98_20330 [Sinorhizobium saheli]|uniref:Uncharacterized protein n=1 Tax=Sinorhizobium saheli TaxID=36856 RepID=A0A178YP92_SINSA|nr:hypothetical protein ATB98_20330 [Sinorhizobium saheli]
MFPGTGRRPLLFRLVFDAIPERPSQCVKGSIQEIAPGDNHIVVSGFHCKPGGKPHGFFEASAHPVSLDGIAVFLGDGEADPRLAFRIVPVEHFEEK